ncbi:prostatic acid phosphatase [Bombus vancouverensis nearcticus]|uniref:prostatic acid phosphatase n=1 Tax=Bombus vancouverensis nearcticus TaxID=2705178 RepID=UPI00143B47C2|nr:prostatic acid phosphatase-like isoform X1 [Bombus vancouverensis nearcticus]
MKRNMSVSIILALFVMDLSHAQNTDFGTIVFANVLYRHGDRTPIRPYPNDPYNNESLWQVPYGQLTNIGKYQHLLLGRWIRKRYSHLLSDLYSPHDIYIQSTDVDRTLMSAESHLAGLYPPVGKQIWSNIKWMPIPVHTIPEDKDNVLAARKYCSRYDYELEKVLNSPEIQKINKENKRLYVYLTGKTGNKISSLLSVKQLYDTLFIENLYNKTLPEWTKSVYPDKLKPIVVKSFTINAYNKILQRLKSGTLLGEMIDHMEKKSKNALVPDRKVWMYSAHDETIANMLMTLNVFEPHCPPYTATILIELRVNLKDQYFVTISYKNTSEEPQLLTLPGCITMCPLNQFIALTKDVIPIDWEKECAIEWEQLGYNMNTTAIIAILTSSILMLVLLILSIVVFIYWHYKREHNQYYLRLTTEPI